METKSKLLYRKIIDARNLSTPWRCYEYALACSAIACKSETPRYGTWGANIERAIKTAFYQLESRFDALNLNEINLYLKVSQMLIQKSMAVYEDVSDEKHSARVERVVGLLEKFESKMPTIEEREVEANNVRLLLSSLLQFTKKKQMAKDAKDKTVVLSVDESLALHDEQLSEMLRILSLLQKKQVALQSLVDKMDSEDSILKINMLLEIERVKADIGAKQRYIDKYKERRGVKATVFTEQ